MKKGTLFQYQTTSGSWTYNKLYPGTTILMALEDLEYKNHGVEYCYYKGLVLLGELIVKAELVDRYVKKVSP